MSFYGSPSGSTWKALHKLQKQQHKLKQGQPNTDNKLNKVKIDKNAELVYYMYDENQELIGIDKAIASSILISFKENGIDDIIFFNQPEGVLYPEDQLEENQKTLFGFINRFEERITKEEKF